MKLSIIEQVVGISFTVLSYIIIARFYDHRNRLYAQDKENRIPGPRHFSIVSRYLQISTLVAVLASLIVELPGFVVPFQSQMFFYMGFAISTLGLAMFISAKLTLGKNYSPCFDSFVPTDIIQDGLYRYIRHPIYTANIILISGLYVMCGNLLVLLNSLILATYYFLSSLKEEEHLALYFPDYLKYKSRTSRFIPWPTVLAKEPSRPHSEIDSRN